MKLIRSSFDNSSSRLLREENNTNSSNGESSGNEEDISASDLEIKEANIILSNSVIKSI